MSKSSEKEQCAAFRYVIGQEGRDIYNTMAFKDTEFDKIEVLFSKFDEYCEPRKNIIMERYKFNTRMQRSDETPDQYVIELKLLAKNCEFGALESELIRDRVVYGITSERVKERLLREQDLTLEKALELCRINEQSKEQMKVLHEAQGVNAIRQQNTKTKSDRGKFDANRRRDFKRDGKKQDHVSSCGKCGKSHPARECPAFGKKCYNCSKSNHFAKFCKSKKKVHTVDGVTDDEPLFIGAVNSMRNENSIYKMLMVEGSQIKFKVDTGSQANILPLSMFTKMNIEPSRLGQSTTKLSSYTGELLPVVGQCSLKCNNTTLNFFVVKTDQDPIIGLKASQDLNLIKIVLNVDNLDDKSAENIHDKFPNVFHGLGCLKDPYHIKIDPTVTPVVNPLRSTPVALREKLKKSLDEMEKTGVVEKVECPTQWVNSAVIIEKPDSEKLRICLDPRPLNEAIQREHFKMPTIEEITTRVAGAKVFSKLDANHGYWQILLDEESRLLTTFNTPFGRYCYKRMPFGIKSA